MKIFVISLSLLAAIPVFASAVVKKGFVPEGHEVLKVYSHMYTSVESNHCLLITPNYPSKYIKGKFTLSEDGKLVTAKFSERKVNRLKNSDCKFQGPYTLRAKLRNADGEVVYQDLVEEKNQ